MKRLLNFLRKRRKWGQSRLCIVYILNIFSIYEKKWDLSYLWYILHPGDHPGEKVMMEDSTTNFSYLLSLWIESFPIKQKCPYFIHLYQQNKIIFSCIQKKGKVSNIEFLILPKPTDVSFSKWILEFTRTPPSLFLSAVLLKSNKIGIKIVVFVISFFWFSHDWDGNFKS